MKKPIIVLLLLLKILITSCSDQSTLPNPTVNFQIDNQLFESSTNLNVYSLENSSSGLKELGIHIRVGEKDLLLFCTTDEIEGTYTMDNSIEGELSNRISLCDEVDRYVCKSTRKCEMSEFTFTIERQESNRELLKGTFEGTVCNNQGETVRIISGSFENFQLFPKCCEEIE